MIGYNPCQGCDFFNKPYWSIVNPCENCYKQFTSGFITTIATNVPSVEYAPVRHGRWVMKETMIRSPYAKNAYCSECLEETSYAHKYCPNCGAKMDLEEQKCQD